MSPAAVQRRSLRISSTDGLPSLYAVHLDGEPIATALTGLSLSIGVDEPASAVLDVILATVESEPGVTQVVMPETTRTLLIALGWTPPEGDGA